MQENINNLKNEINGFTHECKEKMRNNIARQNEIINFIKLRTWC